MNDMTTNENDFQNHIEYFDLGEGDYDQHHVIVKFSFDEHAYPVMGTGDEIPMQRQLRKGIIDNIVLRILDTEGPEHEMRALVDGLNAVLQAHKWAPAGMTFTVPDGRLGPITEVTP